MNRDSQHLQRSAGDFILFGMVFVGFITALAGFIATSVPAVVTGLVILLLGLCGMMLKDS